MTGDKELFSELEEKDLKMHINMGDDSKYSVTGVGTIAFQREHAAQLTLKNVMHVLRLTKNLVSIAMLEDRGYDVIFLKGKAFLQHIAIGQVKKIGIRVQNLYKIEVEDCDAMGSKVENMLSQDIDELWHRLLGHLHHGALKKLQQISISLPKGMLEQGKDKTFTKFCEFKSLVKKDSGKKVKALWSDNSGEYVSNEFKNFYASEWIK
eukprot:PITA_18734